MTHEIIIVPALKDNYAYIIICKETGKVACIDPSEASPVIQILEKRNLKLDYILNTHHHWDHIGGNIELKEKYDAKIIGFVGDEKRIPAIDQTANENEIIKIGNLSAEILFIPGHTLGHIAYYFPNEKALFCGDTLFSCGCGRLFEGTAKQLYESLEKLKNLPDETLVYCGHEYTLANIEFALTLEPSNLDLQKRKIAAEKLRKQNLPTIPSSIGLEKLTNPFLRTISREIRKNLGTTSEAYSEVVFSNMRKVKDAF
jgi:hydroxyacylglutathione hydrolase